LRGSASEHYRSPHLWVSCGCRGGARDCESESVRLIEDACEALGADVRDEQLAAQVRRLRNQGRDSSLDWHQHAEVGFSCRLSDINCALGTSQLMPIAERGRSLAEIYDRALGRVTDIIRSSLTSSFGRISWFVYPVRLAADFGAKDRD
jgi:dTDP-4-amino-4,6-dideoxygalactose transaminase